MTPFLLICGTYAIGAAVLAVVAAAVIRQETRR